MSPILFLPHSVCLDCGASSDAGEFVDGTNIEQVITLSYDGAVAERELKCLHE